MSLELTDEFQSDLIDYIRELALEVGTVDEFIGIEEEPVEYTLKEFDYQGMNCTDDGGEPCIVVFLEGEGSYSILESRAKYNPPGEAHPAEYSYHTIRLLADIRFYPGRGVGTEEIEIEVQTA
ncbi:MAG: hypothetical protein ABEH81_01430 [Halopenitus sp.]